MVQALIDTFDIFSVDYANFTHASKNANAPSSNIGSSLTQKQDLSFVAAGDFGCTQQANRTVTGMVDKRPERSGGVRKTYPEMYNLIIHSGNAYAKVKGIMMKSLRIFLNPN
jgi:hypothetical protein